MAILAIAKHPGNQKLIAIRRWQVKIPVKLMRERRIGKGASGSTEQSSRQFVPRDLQVPSDFVVNPGNRAQTEHMVPPDAVTAFTSWSKVLASQSSVFCTLVTPRVAGLSRNLNHEAESG